MNTVRGVYSGGRVVSDEATPHDYRENQRQLFQITMIAMLQLQTINTTHV